MKLLQKYNLRKKILAYVKGEGFSLNTMIVTLKLVARWEVLGLEENLKGIYFGHAFSKACKYATMDEKVYNILSMYFLKLFKGICNYISLGLKSQGEVNKNGTKHILIIAFPQGN